MTNNFDYLVEEVSKAVSTISQDIRERVKSRSLDVTKFKLFCTVLKRTKSYLDAAIDHINEKNHYGEPD